MRHLLPLTGCLIMLLSNGAVADSLNKCIDAQGMVTYSNLPCKNARETRKVEIDPAPLPEPLRAASKPQTVKLAPPAAPAQQVEKEEPAALKLDARRNPGKPAARPPAGKCDTLSDKLGRVFDKMDAARRKGYTQKQMDDWNQEAKDLERQKQQAGCF